MVSESGAGLGWSRGLTTFIASCVRSATRQPACEVALEAAQVGGAAAVADVAVGTHEVVCRPLDAEPGERLSADVVEDAGCGFASETVHGEEAGVALAQAGELIVVPALGGTTEQEVVGRRRECFL